MKKPESATDRLERSLAAIERHAKATNAFIRLDTEAARATARRLDDESRRGTNRGPLHGLPISIKDLIDIAGEPTTAASNVRRNHVAEHDAPVITRLREAGVVIIGKTNLHEFALGTTSEDSAFGAVHNPHDLSRSAGGSSGGSAAAVASGMGDASVGSDTGGSVRIPAAACGVIGLKPTYGEIPVDGVVPLSKSFDHLGPLARSVEDAAALWAVMAGVPIPSLGQKRARDIRLGALDGYFTALLGAEVRSAFDGEIERLSRAGVSVSPRTVQGTETITGTYVDISLSEAAHWHASTLDDQFADYQPAVRERLEMGRAIPADRYMSALENREKLREAVDSALEDCDALVLPTLAIVAPPLGSAEAVTDNGEKIPVRAAMLRLTNLFNITGHPAISLPIATPGLPIGLQLVGRTGGTAELLAVARSCVAS